MELEKACNYLKLNSCEILHLKEKGIKDKIDLYWDQEILFEELKKYLLRNSI